MAGATIGAARIEMSINSAEFTAQMRRMAKEVNRLDASLYSSQKAFSKWGRSFQRAGRSLMQNVTLPLLALGSGALKAAVDFEDSFAGVRKTVDATETEFASLRQGILDMSKEIPSSAEEIAGIAEAAGQLGIQTENIMSFTRVMADLGVATNMSSDEAATSLARLANITQMSQGDFDRLGSTVVALGNNLATTEAEIVEMAQRLAASGAQAGLAESEILGFAGALSSVGLQAQAGGTAFSKVMDEINLAVQTGSDRLNDFAGVAGMSTTAFAQAFRDNAAGAIAQFVEGLGDMEQRGSSAIATLERMGITERRMRDALLRAAGAGETLRQSIDLGNTAWEENIALTEEAQEKYSKAAAQIKMTWNEIKALAIETGTKLLPSLNDALKVVRDMTDWFANLSTTTLNLIGGLTGIGIILPPAVYAMGKLSSAIAKVIGAMRAMNAAMITTRALSTALYGPVGLIIGAVAVIGSLGYALTKHNKKVGEATRRQREFVEAVKEGNKTFKEAREAVKGFSLTDEFRGTEQLMQAQRERIRLQEETIKKNREGGTLAGKTIAQLKEMEAVRKAHDMQKLIAMEKELDRLQSRRTMLRMLIENENKLAKAVAIAEQTNSSVAKKHIGRLEDQNQKLREQLGLIESIEEQTRQAAKAASKASATISFTGSVGSVDMPTLPSLSVPEIPTGSVERATSQYNSIGEAMETVKGKAQIMGQALQSMAQDSIISFAETLGNAFTGDAGAEGFFNNLLLIVVDFANKFGKLLVAAGIAAEAFKNLIANPIGAIIAGGALIAATTAVKNLLQQGPQQEESQAAGMANGGIVPPGFPGDSYPAMLTSGERVIPDPIPLNKGGGMNLSGRAMEKSMQKAMTNALAAARWKVRGSDLVLVTELGRRRYS